MSGFFMKPWLPVPNGQLRCTLPTGNINIQTHKYLTLLTLLPYCCHTVTFSLYNNHKKTDMETPSIQSKKEIAQSNLVISPEQLLKHWQGHRGVTRKTIEAFPEDKLYDYSVGGMRPFAAL